MKKIIKYINSMYRPSFIVLSAGLAIISLASIVLAISIRSELMAGESDVIYRYPKIIDELFLKGFALIPTVLLVDINERRKESRR